MNIHSTPATAGAVLCTDDGAVLGLVTGRRAARTATYTPTSAALDGATTTAMPVLNAVAAVCAAPPGIVNQMGLPFVTGAGQLRR